MYAVCMSSRILEYKKQKLEKENLLATRKLHPLNVHYRKSTCLHDSVTSKHIYIKTLIMKWPTKIYFWNCRPKAVLPSPLHHITVL